MVLIIALNSEKILCCIDNNDTTNIEENFVEIQIGYFPNYSDSYTSEGIGLSFFYESISENELDNGYYLILRRAFKDRLNTNNPIGSFSLGYYLNFLKNINNDYSLMIRGGIGVGYPTITLNFLSMLMLDFIAFTANEISFSFSILQEIVNFKILLPIQLNMGIRF